MAEIPELGINAKGSYAIQEGSSISEIYHEAAGTLCHSVVVLRSVHQCACVLLIFRMFPVHLFIFTTTLFSN